MSALRGGDGGSGCGLHAYLGAPVLPVGATVVLGLQALRGMLQQVHGQLPMPCPGHDLEHVSPGGIDHEQHCGVLLDGGAHGREVALPASLSEIIGERRHLRARAEVIAQTRGSREPGAMPGVAGPRADLRAWRRGWRLGDR
ncbi:MAG TPA: hypothetical protein DGT21_04885 [Armatimonadetes bacterium]|nr:hypothetical protein [Armatimonadota bacterium]